MRKGSQGYYSIERLFEILEPLLGQRFDVQLVHVPCHSRGVWRCLRNVVFTARLHADVIHVTGDIYYCALGVPRRRCVLTIHDMCSFNRLTGIRRHLFSAVWYWLPLRWAAFVTAISDETRRQLEERYPAIIGKIVIIPNCLDKNFRHPQRATETRMPLRQALQVGTGTNKNLERVAAAASNLPVHLRIIGHLDANRKDFLRSLNITWSSEEGLSEEKLIQEYASSDVLIFASTYEGFGIPILEAQAMGIPVITSSVAPMTDTAGKGALFVNPYSVHQIRAALLALMQGPDLRHLLADLGRRNIERFDAAAIGEKYGEVYHRSLTRRTPHPTRRSLALSHLRFRSPS